MAHEQQLAILKQGVEAWNDWRARNWVNKPDLRDANLGGTDLRSANVHGADFDPLQKLHHLLLDYRSSTVAMPSFRTPATALAISTRLTDFAT
jgi:hypothetical protein